MKNIEALFNKRDKTFCADTKVILEALTQVAHGASEFIDDTYGLDNNRQLVWEGVTLVDNLIDMIGVVSYAPGTTLMFNDEMMNVTDDNNQNFQQLIRIAIPLEIAKTNSAKQVIAYLRKCNEESEIQDQQESNLIEQSADFDLTELSDDQILSMAMNTTKTRN